MAIGTLGGVIGGNTLANYRATATNSSNTFSTGTLVMTNGSCTAVSSGTNCGSLFSVTGMIPSSTSSSNVHIVNSGTLPSTMLLSLTNLSATNSLNSYMNMTIYDTTTSKCLYGKTGQSLPYSGACDTITNLSSQQTATQFAAVGPLTIPGSGGAQWAAAQAHDITISVQLIASASVPGNSTVSADVQWSSTQ